MINKIEVQKKEVKILKEMFEESQHVPTKTILLQLWLKEDAILNQLEDKNLRGQI